MVEINYKFPWKKSPKGGFASNEETIDAVADDLRMLLLTNHGERLIHGDFGANLRKIIFEFNGPDLQQAVRDAVLTATEKWMPFVTLTDIEVRDRNIDTTIGPNQIHLKIKFSVGPDLEGVLIQQVQA